MSAIVSEMNGERRFVVFGRMHRSGHKGARLVLNHLIDYLQVLPKVSIFKLPVLHVMNLCINTRCSNIWV